MPKYYHPTELRNTQQNARLHILLGKLNIDADGKHELVGQFTKGRTASSKGMLAIECNDLIHHLEQLTASPDDQKIYNMRRKVYSLAHQLGWEVPNTTKVDVARVNGFCEKRAASKKPFMAMNLAELVALINQLERINDKGNG